MIIMYLQAQRTIIIHAIHIHYICSTKISPQKYELVFGRDSLCVLLTFVCLDNAFTQKSVLVLEEREREREREKERDDRELNNNAVFKVTRVM